MHCAPPDIVRKLVEINSQVLEQQDAELQTPLHLAVSTLSHLRNKQGLMEFTSLDLHEVEDLARI